MRSSGLLYFLCSVLLTVTSSCSAKLAVSPDLVVNTNEPKTPPKMDFLGSIIHHMLVDDLDPSIQITTSEGVDNPFSVVVFNEIPGDPPYRVEMSRLLQSDPNLFFPAVEAQKTLNELRNNDLKMPFGVLLEFCQYLPGERVTLRVCSQDGKVLKQATCCPHPMILMNGSGESLMEAALISIDRPETVYMLLFPPTKTKREYIFTSGTKQSKGEIPPEKLDYTTFAPEIKGASGGISKIEIVSEGKSYEMHLPWGSALKVKSESEKLKTSYLLDGNVIKENSFK